MTYDECRIEAAAAAIRDTVANRSGRGKPWAELADHVKDAYRQEARAALAAANALRVSEK